MNIYNLNAIIRDQVEHGLLPFLSLVFKHLRIIPLKFRWIPLPGYICMIVNVPLKDGGGCQ